MDLEFSKGGQGIFIVVVSWLCPTTLSIIFLAKGYFFLRTIEAPPLDLPVGHAHRGQHHFPTETQSLHKPGASQLAEEVACTHVGQHHYLHETGGQHGVCPCTYLTHYNLSYSGTSK